MSYIDSRTTDLKDLHCVYNHDIPKYICDVADIEEFNRIRHNSMNEGSNVSGFNLFQYRYSRLDHAFGIGIILDSFKKDSETVIKSMLQEATKPSFPYSERYLIDYFKIKDFKKPDVLHDIKPSPVITECILKMNVSLENIQDLKDSFLVFAEFPHLSCSNLDFVLCNGYLMKIIDREEAKELYSSITIDRNPDGNFEFCFNDINLAKKFFKLSLEVGNKIRSYEAKLSKRLIADVLMLMVRREDIKVEDLYKYSELELLDIGRKGIDKRISEGWNEIENLKKVYTRFNPIYDSTKYCVNVHEKPIYIDPLVITKVGVFRLSKLDFEVENDINAYFSTDTDMFMYIDYEL
jgi:hypothetical protein